MTAVFGATSVPTCRCNTMIQSRCALLSCVLFAAIGAEALAQAPVTFCADLQGASVVPPTASAATGRAVLTLQPGSNQATVSLTTNGLTGAVAAHVHQGASGVNGPVVLTLSASGSSFGGAATLTASQVTALQNGAFYVDVHSPAFPGGEIRGQLHPTTGVFGLTHCPLGNARVMDSGGALRADNIGSSGQDGVEIELSGSRGWMGTYAPDFSLLTPGLQLRATTFGSVGGSEVPIAERRITSNGTSAELSAAFPQGVQSIEVLWHGANGQVIHAYSESPFTDMVPIRIDREIVPPPPQWEWTYTATWDYDIEICYQVGASVQATGGGRTMTGVHAFTLRGVGANAQASACTRIEHRIAGVGAVTLVGEAQPAGPGSPAANGDAPIVLCSGDQRVGGVVSFHAAGLPANSVGFFCLGGPSQPLDLGFVGAPGVALNVTAVGMAVHVLLVDGTGQAGLTMPLPANPVLRGLPIAVQGLGLDPMLPAALPLVASSAAVFTIG